MTAVRYAIPKRPPPSPMLLQAALFEYLLGDPECIEWIGNKPYGQYYSIGSSTPVLYDTSAEYPRTAADLTENQGRLVISVESSRYGDLDRTMRSQLTLFAYSHARPDSGFLAEHAHRLLLQHGKRLSKGQCVQSLYGFRLGKTTYEQDSNLHYTAIMFSAFVG